MHISSQTVFGVHSMSGRGRGCPMRDSLSDCRVKLRKKERAQGESSEEVWLVLAMTMMAVAVAGGLKTEDRGEREETERGSAFTLKPLETTGFSWISEISAWWWLATVTTNTANPSDRRFSVKWAVTATPHSGDWRVRAAREGSGRMYRI